LTRHANEVIENREVHLQEILNQSKVLGELTIGGNGTEDASQGIRKVAMNVIKHSELLSPAMRQKLGSMGTRGGDMRISEKKRWSAVIEKIPEVPEEDHVESIVMNHDSSDVAGGRKWDKGSLQVDVPNTFGVIFVLAKKID
jgi:hypothetical protein